MVRAASYRGARRLGPRAQNAGQARDRGQRMVLVITGKGGPEGGALKRLVPMWLATAPLAAKIAAAAPARPHHGGAGALYVYLRRKRS